MEKKNIWELENREGWSDLRGPDRSKARKTGDKKRWEARARGKKRKTVTVPHVRKLEPERIVKNMSTRTRRTIGGKQHLTRRGGKEGEEERRETRQGVTEKVPKGGKKGGGGKRAAVLGNKGWRGIKLWVGLWWETLGPGVQWGF